MSLFSSISSDTSVFQNYDLSLNGFIFELISPHQKIKVSICNKDGHPVEGKGIGRRIMDKIHETYKLELAEKDFSYDGESSLFTWGALPSKAMDFTVVLDKISSKR